MIAIRCGAGGCPHRAASGVGVWRKRAAGSCQPSRFPGQLGWARRCPAREQGPRSLPAPARIVRACVCMLVQTCVCLHALLREAKYACLPACLSACLPAPACLRLRVSCCRVGSAREAGGDERSRPRSGAGPRSDPARCRGEPARARVSGRAATGSLMLWGGGYIPLGGHRPCRHERRHCDHHWHGPNGQNGQTPLVNWMEYCAGQTSTQHAKSCYLRPFDQGDHWANGWLNGLPTDQISSSSF